MLKTLKYLNYIPKVKTKKSISLHAHIIGNTIIGTNTIIEDNVVLRGDGNQIKIGKNSILEERSTVHVTENMGVNIKDECIIGKFCVVHACEIGQKSIIGENSVIMDGSKIGRNSVILPDTLVPPGKTFPDYSLIKGSPAKLVRKINEKDYSNLKKKIKDRRTFKSLNTFKKYFKNNRRKYLESFELKKKGQIFLADNIELLGNVIMGAKSSIWFGTKILAFNKSIVNIGAGTNVQDNSLITTNKNVEIGKRITIGHNVIILGPAKIEDDAVIGMGSILEPGCIIKKNAFVGANSHVKKNTEVSANTIFAGRPAKFFRNVKKSEKHYFKLGQKVYEKLTAQYQKK